MSDPYRPLLHFAPARHWINDPNGLIHHEGAGTCSSSTTRTVTPGAT